jgi:hypothetical protein
MSLPVDIVWQRLALDDEMMWMNPPGLIYPKPWSPSVVIFYARPQADLIPEEYKESIITYLKVVCSITGTNLLNGDLTEGNPWPANHPASKVSANNLATYYGCYGAILEVDVTPYQANHADVSLTDYPYFIDFQPKKREIYEAVTQSGEILSDSKQSVSVRKSISSVEDLEQTQGITTATVPEFKGVWREEFSNVRTIDASRENREKFAQTTNLSQLYHELNSYYLGTNRALFFLQPRPHVGDPDYQTFLWGPRRLEGIQEFFLVVLQPKTQPGLCVNARLETGHFAFGKIPGQPLKSEPASPQQFKFYHGDPLQADYHYQKSENLQEYYVGKFGQDIGEDKEIDTDKNKGKEKGWNDVKNDNKPVMQGLGWELQIDMAASKNLFNVHDIAVTIDSMGVKVSSLTLKGQGDAVGWPVIYAGITVYLKYKNVGLGFTEDTQTIDFFTKLKTVGACLDVHDQIHPTPTKSYFQDKTVRARKGPYAKRSEQPQGKSQAMNDLNLLIFEALRDQDEVIIEKHGPGPVSNPLHTDFAIQQFQLNLPLHRDSAWGRNLVQHLPQISEHMKARLLESGIETRAQLLEIPMDQLQQRLQLSNEEVRNLYLNAWDVPTARANDDM